ncbi:hypothetical protein J6590_027759 [Homalodisca vitripennis]|nr:hypothetical protein J6590_027759 [Homalodisca vitripennis]
MIGPAGDTFNGVRTTESERFAGRWFGREPNTFISPLLPPCDRFGTSDDEGRLVHKSHCIFPSVYDCGAILHAVYPNPVRKLAERWGPVLKGNDLNRQHQQYRREQMFTRLRKLM